jgi:HPt (histidine-containing phosphotransfer) domain-containing protein
MPGTEIPIEEDLEPLVPVFLDARKDDLERLRGFVSGRNFDGIARLGHTIKGCAQPYGFPTLGNLCRKLEEAARGADLVEVSRLTSSIDEYLNQYF